MPEEGILLVQGRAALVRQLLFNKGTFAMGQLQLSLFGAFQATASGKQLAHFRSAKIQGLLIYLVLTPNQAHDRDALATLFWPNEAEAIARKNLRQSLFRLRHLLEESDQEQPPLFLVTRTAVQLNPGGSYRLDVADFLACLAKGDVESAVSIYLGELLPVFTCDSLPFEDWLRQEREHYHRLALDSLYQATGHSLSRADFPTAQRLARRQLALEPWREEAHQQLMQALAAQGNYTAALAQYEQCRTILAKELGVAPAAETEALLARIRQQRQDSSALKKPVQAEVRPHLTIPFVGRRDEYAALVAAYQRALSDGLQVVVLAGKAGIGKTRLAGQFAAWAALQGVDILPGRAFETSAGLSYQPVTHLLRQRLERENAPDDLLSDLWLSQLTRLLPELRDRYPDLPEPTQEENTARQHLFEAIARVIQALAKRKPLLIWIDDWHWADTASLDLLHYAALRWSEENLPIVIVLTLRQEALGESPDLQSWLTKLNHALGIVTLQLAELSQQETERLIHTLLAPVKRERDRPSDDEAQTALHTFSDWLYQETAGQPLFLTEILKTLVEEGLVRSDPATAIWQFDWIRFDEQKVGSRMLHGIREIIQGWLARLTPQANAVLAAVSILHQQATFAHLCHVAGLEENETIEVLDDLLHKQLLHETRDGSLMGNASALPRRDPTYAFSHQKVSEVVYVKASTARRRMLHCRAFEVLQTSATPAADLAHHALNAGLVTETIRYSLIAGNQALDLFAVRVAISHYEIGWQVAEQHGWPAAISGADQQALYSGLGRAYELIESWQQAQAVYRAMVAYAQSIGSTAVECLGLNRLATLNCLIFDDRKQASACLERALMIAKQSGDRQAMAETVWNLALAAYQADNLDLALQHGEQALDLARNLRHPQLMARQMNMLAYIYMRKPQWNKVEAYAAEASRLYTESGNLVLAADSQRLLGFCQLQSGKLHESLTTLLKTVVFSRRIENVWGQAECARMLAHTHLELGHYGEAITLGREALEQCRKANHSPLMMWTLATWGMIQRRLMAFAGAQQTLLKLLADDTDRRRRGWACSELCAIHAFAGDWHEAHRYARLTFEAQRDEPLLPAAFSGWHETEALLRGGDGDLARAEVERLAEIVDTNRRYRLILLRSQAVLAQWDGDAAQAIEHLEAALALAQEMELPGEAWPILGALGALYAQRGDRAQAWQTYQEAAAIIRRLAATIDEADLRAGFLTAGPVQSILALGEHS